MKTIKDFDLLNKKVIIRVDFNVPIKDGVILDDNRIVMSLDTINYAIANGAKVILLSHLGRVRTIEDKDSKSLKIVVDRLSKLLNRKVLFSSETRGSNLENMINSMKNGDVLLIENKLQEHLMEVDKTANVRFELLMKQFAEKENVTEELKATNQMEWVGKMNAIANLVKKISSGLFFWRGPKVSHTANTISQQAISLLFLFKKGHTL